VPAGAVAQAAAPYRVTTALCALTCALAPAYTVRWHVGFYPTTLLETAILVSLAAFAVETVRERRALVWRSPFLLPALLFLVAGAIAVATAPNRTAGLGLYRAYLVEPILFAFVLSNTIRYPRRALIVVGGLALGAAVAGLANSVVVLNGLVQHTYDVTQTPPVVIYSTANAVALFVGPIVAVAGSLALHGKGNERLGGIAFFVIGVVVMALSFSRGGYLALAAVVAGLALSHRRRLLLLGLVVLGAVGLVLVPPIRHRILIETQNVYGNTIFSRLDLWAAALKLIRDRPIFGAGLSGFQTRSAPYFSHANTTANFIDPHNIVLNFYVETGLLGLIAIVWIFVVGFHVSWRGWRRGAPEWRPYQLGVQLSLVAVVIHGLVDVPYFKNDLSLEFWTLLAITWAGTQWAAKRSAEPVADQRVSGPERSGAGAFSSNDP
jgi:O-antigen ligase